MYHDSLLGAHYGPLNTYYTIKDKYHIHKINKYVASCEECQKQKVKQRNLDISILEFHLIITHWLTFQLTSNTCQKGYTIMNFYGNCM